MRSEPPVLRTTPTWLAPTDEPDGDPMIGWLSVPVRASGTGALLLHPIGYEYWSSHHTLRATAEALAAQGYLALRVDYPGTGDSSAEQGRPDQAELWSRAVEAGVAELRRHGAQHVVLVGLRLGATLALLHGAAAKVDAVVAWAPVTNGRRYVREIRMLGTPVPDTGDGAAGTVAVAGCLFSAPALTALSRMSLGTLETLPAPATLVVNRADRPAETALAEKLRELGGSVTELTLAGSEDCLDQPAEYATVPQSIVDAIVDWVDALAKTPGSIRLGGTRSTATMNWAGGEISETVTEFGVHSLVGVLGRPAHTDGGTSTRAGTVLVWANSGSETHVGPGRAWVEYCRALNIRGHHTLRLDCRGWGESPDAGHAPARPYDAHMAEDLRDVVADLRGRDYKRIVLSGLCAGAWMSLVAARSGGVDGVVAINPQLYWQPGDPVEANIVTETHARRVPEIAHLKKLGRWGVWSALDAAGFRHPAAHLLRELQRTGTRTLILFSDGDDGLEFLFDRTGRTWRRYLRSPGARTVQIAGIDHGMQRHWLRPAVLREIAQFMDELAAA